MVRQYDRLIPARRPASYCDRRRLRRRVSITVTGATRFTFGRRLAILAEYRCVVAKKSRLISLRSQRGRCEDRRWQRGVDVEGLAMASRKRQPRRQRAATVRQLRERGDDIDQIAAELGITPGYVRQLLRDPEGLRNERSYRRYSRPLGEDPIICRLCGRRLRIFGSHLRWAHGIEVGEYRRRFPDAPTVADSEREVRQDLFADQRDRPGEAVYWTEQRIITAIRRWAAQRGGKPPTKAQWWRVESVPRWAHIPERPSVSTVVSRFGTWSAAIAAAGFEPRTRGRQPGAIKRRCKRGHPLHGPKADVYIRPDGYRECRICLRLRRQRRGDSRRYSPED